MIELTEAQRQALAGPGPVRAIDPATRQTYVLVRAEEFERIADLLPRSSNDEPKIPIPAGIRRSQEAFWRNLPQLLSNRKHRGWWVAYHHDECIGPFRDGNALLDEIHRRRIPGGEYFYTVITPREQPPWEPEEIEPLGAHHFDDD